MRLSETVSLSVNIMWSVSQSMRVSEALSLSVNIMWPVSQSMRSGRERENEWLRK